MPASDDVSRPSDPAPPDELLELTATEAVAAMASGALTAERYVQALLHQARRLAHLNALASQDADEVLRAARAADRRRRQNRLGPLHGLPVLIKENINVRGVRTAAGTPTLFDNRPAANAEIVDRLLRAGALLLGTANLHELALGVTSNNFAFGPVRNPYDSTKIPGGSSGGTGAAVGARIVPAGIGTDTAGSVRIPAALCGVVGLRPTVGRYPRTGRLQTVGDIVPISFTRDTPGPIGRTVADVALLDAVITGGPRPVARGLRDVRLGVDRAHSFTALDPEVDKLATAALATLCDRGVKLVEVEIPDLQDLNAAVTIPVGAFEAQLTLPRYLAANDTGVTIEELAEGIVSPDVQALFGLVVGPGAIGEDVYRQAIDVQRPKLQAAYRDVFVEHRLDALVLPTTPVPARPIGDDETIELNGERVSTFFTYIRHTDPGSNAGIPGLTIPAGLTRDGLPVGLELDGAAGSDHRLLAIGLSVEAALGRLPPPS